MYYNIGGPFTPDVGWLCTGVCGGATGVVPICPRDYSQVCLTGPGQHDAGSAISALVECASYVFSLPRTIPYATLFPNAVLTSEISKTKMMIKLTTRTLFNYFIMLCYTYMAILFQMIDCPFLRYALV